MNEITRFEVRGIRSRLQNGMAGLCEMLNPRGMPVEQGRILVQDRNEWKAVVNAEM